jgi:hypothetical protein
MEMEHQRCGQRTVIKGVGTAFKVMLKLVCQLACMDTVELARRFKAF